jgi:predicted nucleotidyltransferase
MRAVDRKDLIVRNKKMEQSMILDFLRTHKEEMHRRFGLVKIGLFGSYARNEQTEESDIDLAVEIESSNKFRSFFELKEYLESHLQEPIDLGIESTIKPTAYRFIRKEIKYV